ncbi:hypothetical protein [Brevundimonas naejangsanensis]|uniref:hypothetical protein n=1 Tax=Brevundimonas naejangsanensis TaxID=588932 RepID=UPI0026F04584|nr:hypothetical protein [Brevundimonas naejangsanensis]
MPRFARPGQTLEVCEESDLLGPPTADGLSVPIEFVYKDGYRRSVTVESIYGLVDAAEYIEGTDQRLKERRAYKVSGIDRLWIDGVQHDTDVAWHIGRQVRKVHGLEAVDPPFIRELSDIPVRLLLRESFGEVLEAADGARFIHRERELEYEGVARRIELQYRTYARRYVLTVSGRPVDGSKRRATFRVTCSGTRRVVRIIDPMSGQVIDDWPNWLKSI